MGVEEGSRCSFQKSTAWAGLGSGDPPQGVFLDRLCLGVWRRRRRRAERKIKAQALLEENKGGDFVPLAI